MLPDGVAELVSSMRAPWAEDDHRAAALMRRRIVDLLAQRHYGASLTCFEGEVRLSQASQLDGIVIRGGAPSQHINASCGLTPFLPCVPRYSYDRPGGSSSQQFFGVWRAYRHEPCADWYGLPDRPCPTISPRAIVESVWAAAFGRRIRILRGSSHAEPLQQRTVEAVPPHYRVLGVTGAPSEGSLEKALRTGQAGVQWLEIDVPNLPDSAGLHAALVDRGLTFIGCLPATDARRLASSRYGCPGSLWDPRTLSGLEFASDTPPEWRLLATMLHADICASKCLARIR